MKLGGKIGVGLLRESNLRGRKPAALPLYLRKSYAFPQSANTGLRLCRRFREPRRRNSRKVILCLTVKHSFTANRAANPFGGSIWFRLSELKPVSFRFYSSSIKGSKLDPFIISYDVHIAFYLYFI